MPAGGGESRSASTIERLRARKLRHRQRSRAYRISFGAVGVALIVAGAILALPLVPGPGLLLIAIGLAMLALEFDRAERLLERALERLERIGERSRGAGALAGAALLVGAVAVAALLVLGIVPLPAL